MNLIVHVLLKIMAIQFNLRPSLNKYLMSKDGWINFTISFKTINGSLSKSLKFHNGKVSICKKFESDIDVSLLFVNNKSVLQMLKSTPNEIILMLLHNKMFMEGNISYLQIFNFLISLLLWKKHKKMLARKIKKEEKNLQKSYSDHININAETKDTKKVTLLSKTKDKNVKHLTEQYLSTYKINNFPRLQILLERHFNTMPELCIERPKLLTEWYRKNGYLNNDSPPALRQAGAFNYLMSQKKPKIADDALIGGTTTAKDPTGVIIYPDGHGTMIWGELKSIQDRQINPYKISEEDIDTLHKDIFPFWIDKNFREYVAEKHDFPDSMRIGERWVFYFVWKAVGISHTIPDFQYVLKKGTLGIIDDIKEKKKSLTTKDKKESAVLDAMILSLEGINLYAKNISLHAETSALAEKNPLRKEDLLTISKSCSRVPMHPADNLHEAMQSIWIIWIALHMENTNTGLSLGRLDQLLQPFFESDISKLNSDSEREEYIKYALELTGDFMMRGTDHLPLVPDIGNYLFGGSSSDQAITLGGVTPEGEDGVNDMTYIFLKATEILAIRDPNVNARYNEDINSEEYLKRLCEVNLITSATPSMHNDTAVFSSLKGNDYKIEHIRDWSATGCVEPTLSGKHMGHTGSILMNMVSALEMALNNGSHPHVHGDFGPESGSIEENSFPLFEDFFDAYKKQQAFLIQQAVELNNYYGEAHSIMRPTPFLSTVIEGCIENCKDATDGGALYNTSGSSNIGLSDIIDSLLAIKYIVYDKKIRSFKEFKKAIDTNFESDIELLSIIKNRVPHFGSGSEEAIEFANRVTSFVHSTYHQHKNFRGGHYTTGFWSMSQHVAYGNLSGTLPSGRIKGKAFTPGLTPHPEASKSFLDNIRDVARLSPESMDNNIAFNVKLNTAQDDSHEDIINSMHSYIKTYFQLGGMQMQFNMVNAKTLKDAMLNPENYKNLLVRISGYNAYFTTLNREMQIELIERAEFGI